MDDLCRKIRLLHWIGDINAVLSMFSVWRKFMANGSYATPKCGSEAEISVFESWLRLMVWLIGKFCGMWQWVDDNHSIQVTQSCDTLFWPIFRSVSSDLVKADLYACSTRFFGATGGCAFWKQGALCDFLKVLEETGLYCSFFHLTL